MTIRMGPRHAGIIVWFCDVGRPCWEEGPKWPVFIVPETADWEFLGADPVAVPRVPFSAFWLLASDL